MGDLKNSKFFPSIEHIWYINTWRQGVYITETVLPDIVADLRVKVKNELDGIDYLSFTSDIWSTEISSDSLVSLTAHWLSPSFERKSVMLIARSLWLTYCCRPMQNL